MDKDSSGLFLAASRFWIQRVFVPIFALMGVVGNSITVMILTRRRMRCTTHIYLTALAVADIIYVLFSLIFSFEHYPNSNNIKYELYWQFYGITRWLADTASYTSVWLTVSFTIERYIIVCHPLKGKVYCTERRAKNIITFVALVCLFSTMSTTFEHRLTINEVCENHCNGTRDLDDSRVTMDVVTPLDSNYTYETTTSPVTPLDGNYADETTTSPVTPLDGNCTYETTTSPDGNYTTSPVDCCALNETCCTKIFTIGKELTELGKNERYISIFFWFSSIVFYLLPVVLVAMFNCFLIQAVFDSTKARKAIINSVESSKQRNEYRVTILLIGIIILFLICQTPTAVFLMYATLDDSSDDDIPVRNMKLILGNIFNFLQLLNASCNFVMYCLLSKNYRRTFRSVFCVRKLNRQDTNALSETHLSRTRRTTVGFGNRRNKSEYRTPRNLETSSLTSIPRSKSLMVRPLGKARSTDLCV